LQLDHGGEEQQVGDEVGDDGHADENVVGAAHGCSCLPEDCDEDAGCAVDGDGYPRSAVARVNGAEDGRKIVIDACDEGEARCGGEICGGRSYAVDADEQGDGDQDPAEPEAIAEGMHSIDEALKAAYRVAGECDEESAGSADVAGGDYDSPDQDGPGDRAAGVLDFISHGAAGFDSAESEEDS